jgi:hypothetical protein
MKPPFFIVGCPRSGTTLLRGLLQSHPNLTIPTESHFIPSLYKAYGDPASPEEAIRLGRRILNLQWVQRWELNLAPEGFANCSNYREVVCRVFEAWAEREGKPRWGDKTPQNLTEMPTLLAIFPEAKIIHIVRDGRDVAVSWLRTPYHPRNTYYAAYLWHRWVQQAYRTGQAMAPESHLLIRYEDLLRDTPATMHKVCKFIGEPYTEAVLQPTRVAIGLDTSKHQISSTKIVPTNTGKWRTGLSREDRVRFESVAGDLLETLGYEPEGIGREISAPERCYWHAHQFVVSSLHALSDVARDPQHYLTRLRLRWTRLLARARTGS